MTTNDYIEVFEKASSEQLPKSVLYADRVPDGETISSATVSATNLYSGAADNSVLSGTTATVDTDALTATIAVLGGNHGDRYVVSFRAVLSDGSTFRDDLLMVVKDNQVGG